MIGSVLMFCAIVLSGCQGGSPYAGQEGRDIKSLSPAGQVDLAAGRGMALAKAAELNGYPGPLHVLQHAEALRLTPDQRAETPALFDRMNDRARALGAALIEAERDLDRAFGEGRIDSAILRDKLGAISRLQGELRFAHLDAHLAQHAILSADQVQRYNRLRGYAGAGARAENDG
jgi:Spy/CpxP family protein refolding chaperone